MLFSRHTAPKIAGIHDQHFWTQTVIQLGHSEPAIRCAIQAVSAVYDQVERNSGGPITRMDPKALGFYNSAIGHILRGQSGEEVHMAVAALFVCLEFLLGDEHKAAIHINGGAKLLRDWNSRARLREYESSESSTSSTSASATPSPTPTRSESELIDDMTSMFFRLGLHSKIFGKRLFRVEDDDDPEREIVFQNRYFKTFNQARDDGFRLTGEAVNFIARGTPLAYLQAEPDNKVLLEQALVVRHLQDWRRAYAQFLQEDQHTIPRDQVRAGHIVTCLIICAVVWVETCLSPYENDYDKYISEWEKILELAEIITDLPDDYLCENIGRFSFDIGIIPALHLVGSRCRVPKIRDGCIKVLSSHHWREGLFDSFRSAQLVKSCIDIENAAKQKLMGLKPSELEDYLPCEGARIHFVSMGEEPEEDGTQLHGFYSKPYGAYGDWHIQLAYLPATLGQLWHVLPTKSSITKVLPNTAFTIPDLHHKPAGSSGKFNPTRIEILVI